MVPYDGTNERKITRFGHHDSFRPLLHRANITLAGPMIYITLNLRSDIFRTQLKVKFRDSWKLKGKGI